MPMSEQKIYGLIGKQLSHSFSQNYFRNKIDNQGIEGDYLNFELNDISEVNDVLYRNDIKGLNVTIPYKETIIPYLNEVSSEAKEIGAVNTIQIQGEKRIGHNTDAFGFAQMIKPFFKSHHERAMILGTGGASKAVDFVLEKLGCDVIFISRTPTDDNHFGYPDINPEMMDAMKLIVNTTPVGMYPKTTDFPEIPYNLLTPNHLVVDLIYNPKETEFLRKAKAMGAVTLNGQTMLEQQAEKSWQIWNE